MDQGLDSLALSDFVSDGPISACHVGQALEGEGPGGVNLK